MLDTGKPLSESHRVYELLASAIRRGGGHPGISLDTTELMERYGATRSAVREALSMLTDDGVLERAPRRGTHVRTHLTGIDLGQLRTHRNLALPLRELFVRQVTAPALVADRFDAADSSILLVERLLGNVGTLCLETSYIRGADESDVRRFLDAGADRGSSERDDRTRVPLEEYFAAVFGEPLDAVQLSVQVTTARARVAQLLELDEGTAVFLIERVLTGRSGVQEISFATSEARHSYLALS